jgi:hypothetical protein
MVLLKQNQSSAEHAKTVKAELWFCLSKTKQKQPAKASS